MSYGLPRATELQIYENVVIKIHDLGQRKVIDRQVTHDVQLCSVEIRNEKTLS